MLELILIAAVFMGLVVLGLGINIFFSKKKKFPQTHVGRNKDMAKMGLSCASKTDTGAVCSCHHTDGACVNLKANTADDSKAS